MDWQTPATIILWAMAGSVVLPFIILAVLLIVIVWAYWGGEERNAMSDQADIDAERLLPCCGQGWITDNEQPCPAELPSCVVCTKRKAVAAALRELREEITTLTTDRNGYGDMCQELQSKLDAAKHENAKLQAVFAAVAPTNSKGYEGLLGTGQRLIDLESQLAAAKAEIERLKNASHQPSARQTE